MKTLATLFLLLAFAAGALAQEVDDAFARGNEEYRAGRFSEAADLYAKAVQATRTNAPLFYNLGNASYRAGDLGRAILSYERALALEPVHPEARANLQIARDKARALQLPATASDQWLARLQPKQYSIIAAVAFWLAAFGLAASALSRRRSRGRIAASLFALLICVGSCAAIYRLETGPNGRALGIVTGKEIAARLATADSSGTVLILPTGSEIQILSTRGEWTYAALPNGLRGWIPANSAERVRL
ncbi:MAG: tetratricopeptide repeat protein [Chthoniobacterales bacterium]